jgi:uncharacterized protein YoxC
MPSNSLLELERLTRHPVELTGFQSVSSNPAVPKTELVQSKGSESPEVIDGVVTTPISRREFMMYGLSGAIGLLLGIGWWKSDTNADHLAGTLESVGQDVTHMEQNILELQRMISTLGQEVESFEDTYQPTLEAIAYLNQQVNNLSSQYQQLDQVGEAIANLLQEVSLYAALIPQVERYAQPINTMVDMVKENTPAVISAATAAIARLSFWFSNEGGQGVNNRLLMPTAAVFQMIDNEIKTDMDGIQAQLD